MQFDLKSRATDLAGNIRKSHVAIAVAVVVTLIWPMWVLLGLLLIVFVVGGTASLLGMEQVWRMILARLNVLAERDPDRAEAVLARLDRWAVTSDRMLDWLPASIAEPLYFPDLQQVQITRVESGFDTRLAQIAAE